MAEQDAPAGGRKKKILFVALFAAVMTAGVGGYYVYDSFKSYVSTDNAYVKEDFTIISPRIGGTVISVGVKENEHVKKGALIAEIDPRDYQVKVAQAETAVMLAKNQTGELKAKVREADADIAGRAAELAKAKLDFDRARRLYEKQAIPKDQLEKAETLHLIAQAQHDGALKQKEKAQAALGESIQGQEAIVRRNEELLREARQYLGYTKIYAPQDGYIARKTVETGNVVGPGQPLMALVPMREPYVEANFKETEVGRIRVGDAVTIKVDVYGDRTFDGVVDSISAGTGVSFSLLPPENATGNWIKVVQRVPVKIKITSSIADTPMRLGLSCEVKVKVKKERR